MTTMTSAEAVANGAQMLDEHVPGWYKLINLDTLSLESCERCICGQLGRELGWGLFPGQAGFWESYGFDALDGTEEQMERGYAELDDEWFKAIVARRAADNLDRAPRKEKVLA